MMRKSALFLVVIATMLAALVLPVALGPASSEASINDVVWLDTVFKGSDPLLGYVQAYEAGATAVLKISILNTTGDTITIKGAKVKFDWTGGEYTANAGDYPGTLANNQSGTATIGFTVPDISIASNQVRHSYTVSVDYEREGGYTAGTQVNRENVGTGNGYSEDFWLDHNYIDPVTLQVYLNGVLTTDYQLDCDGQTISFNTAPGSGVSISADYQYVELVGWGNGSDTLFYLDHSPVVSGTQKIYVDCTLSTSYTLEDDTGRIRFSTPPAAGRSIIANYQYVARWTVSGDDFAVYSPDQNSAMAVRQQLYAVGTPSVNTAGSRRLLAESAMETQLGDQAYAAGNLDDAKAHYDQAFVYLDKALKNDKDPNFFKAVEPTGTLLLGIGMVLLAFGVILYVIRRPKGPSGA
ncbi:MAG: hypothetical protein JW753_06050 [Dehalococcoidia bacterium]|nr:hypothetical protein [Dehalococcoidia bacterium]